MEDNITSKLLLEDQSHLPGFGLNQGPLPHPHSMDNHMVPMASKTKTKESAKATSLKLWDKNGQVIKVDWVMLFHHNAPDQEKEFWGK